MKELSPPWHRPSVKCAGAGEGLLGQLERRIGKPGETRRRKVTGLSRSLTTGQGRYVRRTASGKPGETRRRKVTGLSCSLTSGQGRYVRRTANGKLRETAGRKGWTFSAGNCGMVARPPDSLHPKYEAKKGINYYDTANQSEPFFAAVSCSSFINFNLHLDVAQCRLCSRQRQRCRQQFRNYNWQR